MAKLLRPDGQHMRTAGVMLKFERGSVGYIERGSGMINF